MFGDLDWPLNVSRGFVSISWAACYLTRKKNLILSKILADLMFPGFHNIIGMYMNSLLISSHVLLLRIWFCCQTRKCSVFVATTNFTSRIWVCNCLIYVLKSKNITSTFQYRSQKLEYTRVHWLVNFFLSLSFALRVEPNGCILISKM